jgi:Heparinase II/III-like protein/Heparinase II/III N-terminus
VRGAQALAAFAERHSLSSQVRLGSDREFAKLFKTSLSSTQFRNHFQNRQAPAFFAAFIDREATLTQLRRHWPDAEQRILAEADRILNGRFDLLGFRDLFFGNPIDWHFEPVANKRTPLLHWSRLNYLNAQIAGDKKIIWELNRHQYFVRLGQAYWLSGDERYAAAFNTHVNSWMDQNPPKLGINWASSLEVAFRSISWLWALHFFKDSAVVTDETFGRISQFFYRNARHLETYLSTYFSPNTHLTGEALGLFYLGTLLPEFRDAKRWQQTGLRILFEQLSLQVKPDGVYFEQSSYYHRYTVDFYLHLSLLLEANGETVPREVLHRLELLLDHSMFTTRPDGTTPLFGDDDGGRLLKLDQRQGNDFRSSLSTGAALFKRPDYKFVAGGIAEETLWLVGPERLSELEQLQSVEPSVESAAFADGGYYVMRDGWTPISNYLLFDCGPHGIANCGHAHADALSFELAANGRTLLVDPGTYTYTGSRELRDWFRSSPAHNTLTVNGQSSSVSDGPFSWSRIAHCQRKTWITQKRFDYVSAAHDGYQSLPNPATHTRSILFLKRDYWVMRDQVASEGDHQLRLGFQFDSSVTPLNCENHVHVLGENGHTTRLRLFSFPGVGEWTREVGWVSHCYAEKEEAPFFAFSVAARGSEELVTFLLPELTGALGRPALREIEAVAGSAFEVNIGSNHDILMLGGFGVEPAGESYLETNSLDASWLARVETARMASDFELTWVRFSHETARTPDELVLIGGTSFELEGREIINSTRRIDYLVAKRIGEQYRVETHEGVLDLSSLAIGDPEVLFGARGT